jgi:hypothetical protein
MSGARSWNSTSRGSARSRTGDRPGRRANPLGVTRLSRALEETITKKAPRRSLSARGSVFSSNKSGREIMEPWEASRPGMARPSVARLRAQLLGSHAPGESRGTLEPYLVARPEVLRRACGGGMVPRPSEYLRACHQPKTSRERRTITRNRRTRLPRSHPVPCDSRQYCSPRSLVELFSRLDRCQAS